MKVLFLAIFVSSILAAGADARDKVVVFDRAMDETTCDAVIHGYASRKNLALSVIGSVDYILEKNGEKVGNAYWSTGGCYIYLDQ